MMRSLFLILTLLTQQLALGLAASAGQDQTREKTSCCETIVKVSCCCTRIERVQCDRNMVHCTCGMDSQEPEPAPYSPTQDLRDATGMVFQATTGQTTRFPSIVRTRSSRATLVIHRTHNETQALLCIWRT